ncbi:hypothetical protein HPB51_024727 [Rhipicephalus microplus]|uniref:Ketoreductase domain-containing protein n=1 Tax=Rhipicephalus microplus TaxID=6941 RepID=A0A9J6EVF0_RHIMP|nr:hypothetical protein HPB51_024727 [Rhipicephalus microplus]
MVRTHFYEHKSYVITGGLGGFGLELADWMVTRGCRKLLLTSRSGLRTGYQKLCLRRWRAVGVEVLVRKADVSADEEIRMVIQEAATMGPIGGIFNLAMVLIDALLVNQTIEAFDAVCKPKVVGLAIQWGVIGDVGIVRDSAGADAVIGNSAPQRIRSCMSLMDQFLNQRHPVVSSFVKADFSRKSCGDAKPDLMHSVSSYTR